MSFIIFILFFKSQVGRVHLLPFELLELDKELFAGAVSPHSFLRGCYVHIITDHSSLLPTDAAKFQRNVRIMKFELDFFGGSYFEELTATDGITHILVPHSCGVQKIQEVQEQVKNTVDVKPLLLCLDWLKTSLQNRRRVKEDDYLMWGIMYFCYGSCVKMDAVSKNKLY